VLIGVGQQRKKPCALDRGGQLALISRLGSGDAARHDFTGFGNVLFQGFQILVIDLIDAFRGELERLRRK
jgi:hypothetical protein